MINFKKLLEMVRGLCQLAIQALPDKSCRARGSNGPV